jgi:hypothetical protein
VFDAMEEHTVAKKAGAVLRQAVQLFQEERTSAPPDKTSRPAETLLMQLANASTEQEADLGDQIFTDPFQEVNLDFINQLFPFEDNYLSPWPA